VVLKSLLLFGLAGICEIGGGYLVWLWLRAGKGPWLGGIGLVVLGLYGVIATWQSNNFGRVYAAYGGIFILMALLWGWWVDRVVPDQFDWLGAGLALLGALIIMYAPRH
jgi:small multidrug resistance family-3 protein